VMERKGDLGGWDCIQRMKGSADPKIGGSGVSQQLAMGDLPTPQGLELDFVCSRECTCSRRLEERRTWHNLLRGLHGTDAAFGTTVLQISCFY
jgi:hypothetical protein